MFEHLTVRGPEGTIRWGYLPAVSFGPWQFEHGTLTAQIVSCDEFRAQQAPLVAIVPMGRAEWRWSVRSLQITGSTLTATVVRE